jgi:hypothetical protein
MQKLWCQPSMLSSKVTSLVLGLTLISAGNSWSATSPTLAEPYHVGVWFFTAWNSAATDLPLLRLGKRAYGRVDPWVGVRDYAEGRGAVKIANPGSQSSPDFSGRKPLIGFYDLMSQSVVDTEIEEAASEGIEFFAFYWYINPNTGNEEAVSAPVEKFFSSSASSRMRFLLAPIVGPGPNSRLALGTWQSTVVPKIVSYMSRPSYMRLNGRPVLIEFSLNFTSPSDGREANKYLREAVYNAVGANPLIISLLGQKATYKTLLARQQQLAPDGFTCFNFPIQGNPEPYSLYSENWLRQMTAQVTGPDGNLIPNVNYIPCGSIGVDARPWYSVGWGNWGRFKGDGPNDRPFTTGTTPATFEENLYKIKAFIDSNSVTSFRTVVLYAWNEWGEAADAIEPSAKVGYAYAGVVARVFGLTPRCPRPVAFVRK